MLIEAALLERRWKTKILHKSATLLIFFLFVNIILALLLFVFLPLNLLRVHPLLCIERSIKFLLLVTAHQPRREGAWFCSIYHTIIWGKIGSSLVKPSSWNDRWKDFSQHHHSSDWSLHQGYTNCEIGTSRMGEHRVGWENMKKVENIIQMT